MHKTTLLALAGSLLASAAAAQTTSVAPLDVTSAGAISTAHDVTEVLDNDGETDGFEWRVGFHPKPNWYDVGSATLGLQATDPKWRFRLGTDYAVSDRLDVGLVFDHVNSRSGFNDDGDFVRNAPYDTLSAKLRLALNAHISFAVVASDLANKKYFDGLATVGEAADNGRSVRGLMDVEF